MARIAVCDDERKAREDIDGLVREYVKEISLAATVDGYLDGEGLLEGFQEQPYDIVLLDIYMEGLIGIEAAKKIRATGR